MKKYGFLCGKKFKKCRQKIIVGSISPQNTLTIPCLMTRQVSHCNGCLSTVTLRVYTSSIGYCSQPIAYKHI